MLSVQNQSPSFKGIKTANGAIQTYSHACKKLLSANECISGLTIQTSKKERLTAFSQLADACKLFVRVMRFHETKNVETVAGKTVAKNSTVYNLAENSQDIIHECVNDISAKAYAKGIKTPQAISKKIWDMNNVYVKTID